MTSASAVQNGVGRRIDWLGITQLAVAIMLPGVGFLAAQVTMNTRTLSRLEGQSVTHEKMNDELQEHSLSPHPGAVTREELQSAMGEIRRRLEGIEKALRER